MANAASNPRTTSPLATSYIIYSLANFRLGVDYLIYPLLISFREGLTCRHPPRLFTVLLNVQSLLAPSTYYRHTIYTFILSTYHHLSTVWRLRPTSTGPVYKWVVTAVLTLPCLFWRGWKRTDKRCRQEGFNDRGEIDGENDSVSRGRSSLSGRRSR